MIKLQDISEAIKQNDPEMEFLSEEGEDSLEGKAISLDMYKDAIDSANSEEVLNFSADDKVLDGEENKIEQIPIPQNDSKNKRIEIGNRVKKVIYDSREGEVLAVGELVEVLWDGEEELCTLEYPEEIEVIPEKTGEEGENLEKTPTIKDILPQETV